MEYFDNYVNEMVMDNKKAIVAVYWTDESATLYM